MSVLFSMRTASCRHRTFGRRPIYVRTVECAKSGLEQTMRQRISGVAVAGTHMLVRCKTCTHAHRFYFIATRLSIQNLIVFSLAGNLEFLRCISPFTLMPRDGEFMTVSCVSSQHPHTLRHARALSHTHSSIDRAHDVQLHPTFVKHARKWNRCVEETNEK